MAQYQHLNIYKKSFELLVEVTKLITHFQREYRYTLGEKLNNDTIEFIVLIYKANSAKRLERRAEVIKEMIEKLQYINVVLRLLCELKNISKERYIDLAKMTLDIEKQLSAWLKHTISQSKTGEEEQIEA